LKCEIINFLLYGKPTKIKSQFFVLSNVWVSMILTYHFDNDCDFLIQVAFCFQIFKKQNVNVNAHHFEICYRQITMWNSSIFRNFANEYKWHFACALSKNEKKRRLLIAARVQSCTKFCHLDNCIKKMMIKIILYSRIEKEQKFLLTRFIHQNF